MENIIPIIIIGIPAGAFLFFCWCLCAIDG